MGSKSQKTLQMGIKSMNKMILILIIPLVACSAGFLHDVYTDGQTNLVAADKIEPQKTPLKKLSKKLKMVS